MAGEKYVIAATENITQITIRNILNPQGYNFLGNCSDPISLLRLIRSYHPDFIVADANLQMSELRGTLNTIDEEMLCACVIIGNHSDVDLISLLERYKVMSFCPKPLNKEILINTVEMANLNFKRVNELLQKLKEMTETLESRRLVEKAKWILMEKNKLSENEAYERMRKKSMDNRMSMKSIAEAIIIANEIS